MIELSKDECKATRDIASGRPPAIDIDVVEQLKARKLINSRSADGSSFYRQASSGTTRIASSDFLGGRRA
jgi:hypothetical protein